MAKSKRNQPEQDPWNLWQRIGWLLLAGTWLLVVVALVSYHPADPPAPAHGVPNDPPQNWIGAFGAHLAHQVYFMFGPGAWLLVAGLAAFLFASVRGWAVSQVPLRAAGLLVMAVTVSAIINLGSPLLLAAEARTPGSPGGWLAVMMNDQLISRFARPGTAVVLFVAFWIGALLTVDELVLALPRALGRLLMGLSAFKHVPRPALAAVAGRMPTLRAPWRRGDDGTDKQAQPGAANSKSKRRRAHDETLVIDEDAGGVGGTEAFDPDDAAVEPDDEAAYEDDEYEYEYEYEDEEDGEADEADAAADAPNAYLAHKRSFDPDELRAKIKKLPINFADRTPTDDVGPREPDLSGYQFPGLDLLNEPESDFNEEMEQIVRQQAVDLESALQQYKIQGEVVGIDSGPVITMFEVRLAPGTKTSQVNSVSTDIARALKAHNIRIVPNMAGKDTIGIEVPNLKKEKVRLRELMAAAPDASERMSLPMFLGKDASGNPLIEDLAAMPHMLIAGTTGSGKSVCESSIIMSLMYTRRPDEVKLVLVDPKVVEMSMFKDIPHLMCPVVTEMNKAAAILEWAVTKMDERYELLAEAQVRDIKSYNALEWEELKERFDPQTESEEARIPKKLPYMVFVIDELADLMMTNKEVENHIVRIAQKARAVGIHLVLATQRPQANVVTGLIKSNMPCRIAMKVASGMDSRIVLDQKGAELLLGHGDMLFLSSSSHKLIRAQGTLVDDSEIRKTTRFLKTVANQHFEPQLVQLKSAASSEANLTERDPMFQQAVEVVLETQRGSVSLLQRRLTIGYGRASRLIEEMAEAGIIGEYKGSQAREVLIGEDEWAAIKAQAEADAAKGTLYEDAAVEATPDTDEDVESDEAEDDGEWEYEDETDSDEEGGDDEDDEGEYEYEDEDGEWEYVDEEEEGEQDDDEEDEDDHK